MIRFQAISSILAWQTVVIAGLLRWSPAVSAGDHFGKDTQRDVTQQISNSGQADAEGAEVVEQAPGYITRSRMQALADQFSALVRSETANPSALVALAESSTLLWCYGFVAREEVLPAARAAATKAVEVDDSSGAAHTVLGAIRLMDSDRGEAEREFKRGIELSPADPKCRHWYGMYLADMGRDREALEQSQRAVELDPSGRFRIGRGAILYLVGQWAEMIDYMQEKIERDPSSDEALDWLGMALVQVKKFSEGIQVYRLTVELSGSSAEMTARLGHAYGVAGCGVEAKQILAKLEDLAQRWYVPPVQIAYVCAGLGQDDRVFELLDKACQKKSRELVFVRTEPWFDHLHSNPRFLTLLGRMNVPIAEAD